MIGITMNKEVIIPSKGHLLHEESVILPEYQAFESVQSNLNKYTIATRDAGLHEIRLIWHWYECANCFQTFSAPFKTLADDYDENETNESKELSENKIDLSYVSADFFNWALQLTLPGLNVNNGDFIFFELPNRDESLACPHCGHTTHTTTRTFNYRVDSNQYLTTITQTFNFTDGWVAVLPYGKPISDPEIFPLKAQVIFNHENRYTTFLLSDNHGEIIEQSILNAQRNPLSGYVMLTHINSDTPLKKVLAETFGRFYGGSLPFEMSEITLHTFILLNQFQGFPKDFYNAIPFSGATRKIDDSFNAISTYLMNTQYKDIDTIYRHYGLPDKKSIRNAIFNIPALLFYAEELAALPFCNVDILLQILKSDDIFNFLSKLHSLPGISVYLAAMIYEKGEAKTWASIKKYINFLEDVASLYLLSPQKDKKLILRKAIKDFVGWHYQGSGRFKYNLPVQKSSTSILDSRIDGYDFYALRNTFEYREAGIKLRNCLADYHYNSGNIYIVKHNQYPLAAIEVHNNEIVHALLAENESIKNDERLYIAFIQWAKINRLKVNLENGPDEVNE